MIEASGDTGATFHQGRDYGGKALARFFNLADAAGRNVEDEAAAVALDAGVLSRGAPLPGSCRSPGTQAVISFTAVQPDDASPRADEIVDERRRESVLRHEASRGRFHTRPAHREHSRDSGSACRATRSAAASASISPGAATTPTTRN